jgi:hypothetical protein
VIVEIAALPGGPAILPTDELSSTGFGRDAAHAAHAEWRNRVMLANA